MEVAHIVVNTVVFSTGRVVPLDAEPLPLGWRHLALVAHGTVVLADGHTQAHSSISVTLTAHHSPADCPVTQLVDKGNNIPTAFPDSNFFCIGYCVEYLIHNLV